MKFAIKSLIVAAAMASMLSGAQAATLTVIGLAPGSTTYTKLAPLPPALQFSAAGAIISTLAGAPGYSLISGNLGSGTTSFTFCVELFQGLSAGSTSNYNVVDPAGGTYTASGANGWGPNAATISGKIDSLLAFALPSVNSAATASALQLAIWEVIYEGGPYDVFSGTGFAVSLALADMAVGTLANTFLGGIGTPVTRHYSVLTHSNFQDVLSPAPEPMSASLVMLGLLGAAAARRRKSTD